MSSKREVTSYGVVIGRAPSGEGSARVFLYTESDGLVAALARSGREERSKLRPHLQVGSVGSYTLVFGLRDTRVIGAVETSNILSTLVDAPAAAMAAARVMSVLRQLIYGEGVNEELFQALWHFLHALPSLSEEEVRIAERLAMVRILRALGYVPQLANIPHLDETQITPETLKAVEGFERELVVAINEGLAASGLL